MTTSPTAASRPRARWAAAAAAAVLRHPSLWATGVVQVGRLAAPGWWRHRPFLPLPDADYLRFRLQTAYGDDRDPEPGDVVTYLHWCRAWPHVTS
ncbi:MAG: hypothetical protein JWM05_3015 [Acidimicrobiales bacterium]|nr:hypothetical protein [Acidimicrobiales bacterium]